MRKIYSILLALVATVAIQAQTQDNAMYVYRNDGGFNAFLREDIDSITLSHFDLDSIQHKEPVCQVFHTPDSIYRIPIEAIDSVSFVQPETKFAPGVIQINDWLEYFSHLDENRLAISFLPTLPYTAQKGDVLLFTVYDEERLPDGFAGKVSSVEHGDFITFVCDSIGVDDIFENLVMIGKFSAIEETEDAEGKENSPRKINVDEEVARTVKIPFGLDEEEKNGSQKLKLNFGGDVHATMKATVIIKIVKDEPFYANLQVSGKMGVSLKALLEAEGTWQRPMEENFSKYLSKAFIDIPIPNTLNTVKFKMRAAPLCKITGKAKLEAEAHADVEASIGVVHENGEFLFTPGCKASAGYSASFGLEGDMFAGIRLYPYLTGVGEFFRLGVKMDVGPKLHGQFLLQSEVSNTNGKVELPEGLYDRLKDTKAELKAGVFLSAEAKFKVFNKEFGKDTGSLDLFWPISEYYLLPEFTMPKIEEKAGTLSIVASSTPSRDLLMPVQLGMALEDSDGNLKDAKYYSANYWQEKAWPSNALWGEFDNLKNGNVYKVMPILKILGMELKASPSKEFKIEGEELCHDANHVHMVDLGLSVKWACCNVGASSPEQYGSYYAWGETEVKNSYTRDNSLTGGKTMGDIAGTSYDVAHVKWGGNWRMPRQSEIRELCQNCSWQWTTVNGVNGQKVTGPNGNSIFIPAAGYRHGTSLDDTGRGGGYWGSTPDESRSGYAYSLGLVPDLSGSSDWAYRYYGFPVRPVSE